MKVAIEDFANVKKLGGLTLSPSGRKAAFTVTVGSIEDNAYRTDIWVYDPGHTPALFRLTAGEDGKAPCFLDEDTILFPADRHGRHKPENGVQYTVYNRIALGGGEAEEDFVLPFAASGLTPLGEGKFLVSGLRDLSLPDLTGLSGEEKAAAVKMLEEEKDYEVFDELPFWFNGRGVINKKRRGLYLVCLKTGENSLLTAEYFDLHGFSVNQEKDRAVFWGNEFTTLNSQKSRMFVCDLKTMQMTEVQLDGRYRVDAAVFCGETVVFAAATGEKYGSSENPAFYICASDGSFTLLAAPDPSLSAVGSDIAGGGDSFAGDEKGVTFVQTVGYHSVYRRLKLDGEIETLAAEPDIISCAQGTNPIYLIGMEKDAPQEFYRVENGQLEKLSAFNADYLASHEIAHTEHFTFTDSDGVEIDGWVLYPADFDKNRKYPGILDVHGGPQTAYGEGFFHEMQYWAGLGYIVFFCNPRGSSGKGGGFADIYGDNYGVRDYNDLMEFTDQVLERVPQIDPARIGMTGGS